MKKLTFSFEQQPLHIDITNIPMKENSVSFATIHKTITFNMKTKKDKHYIPILYQPIEELKKPIGEKVDFNAVMKKALSYNVKKKGGKK